MTNQKILKIGATAITLTVVLLIFSTIATLNNSQNLDFDLIVKTVNVEVYLDAECTQPCTKINAGTLNPGSISTHKVYVKNTGSVPLTLSMTADSWNPTFASNYLTLSWNQEKSILNAESSLEATLELSVTKNTGNLTTFSFSATITGMQ